MTGTARALLLSLALAIVVGCDGTTDREIPLPDFANLELQVVARIELQADEVDADPGSPAAWGRLGMVLDAHRFHTESAECYRKARSLDAESFDWTYNLAVVLDALDAGIEEVAGLLESAAELRPGYAPLHCRYGNVLTRRGLHEEARREFERAIEIDADFAAAHRGLGQLLLLLGDAVAATEHLERAATLAPRDRTTFSALAQALRLTGDLDGAHEAARLARARQPKSAIPDPVRSEVAALNISSVAVASRARSAMARGRHEAAIVLFHQADDWNPGSSGVQYGLGVCYLKTGRLELAEQHLRSAIEINGDAEAHWRLASMLLARGDTPSAADHLRQAVQNAHEGDTNLLIQIATGLARADAPEESLPLFERSLALGGETAPLSANWGSALLQLNRFEEALVHFRRAIELDPDIDSARLNAGRALERLGRTAEAAAVYREELERNPDGPARRRLEDLGARR